MTTRDEPPDPQEVLEAAEAEHLAARHTVPITRQGGADGGESAADRAADQGDAGSHPTVRLEHETVQPDRETIQPDRETVRLPRQRPAGEQRRRAPLPVAAGVAAVWAAVLTFVPVAAVVTLVLAAEAGPMAVGGPIRAAAAGWLLAHGVPVQTAAGPVGLAPLALCALAGWRVVRAGVHVTRARGARDSGSVRQALVVALAVGIGYGLIGAVMAAVAGGPGWGPGLLRGAVTLFGFGILTAGYGSLRTTGALGPLRERVPVVVRAGARTGAIAAVGVLAAGAATAGTALAIGGGPAAELLAAYGTGVAGQAGLTLLCLAYAPNLTVWAAAYLVGPGFAVGAGSVVRSSEVVMGPLPALPVFAGLPSGPLPGLGAALLVAPVVAGGVGGWLLARSGRLWPRQGRAPWIPLALAAVVAGVASGVLLGLLAAASGGPLGDGQLALLGPDPVPVALSTAATVTVGALLGAAVGMGPGGSTNADRGGTNADPGRPRGR